MALTKNFRRQHTEILDLAGEISDSLDPGILSSKSDVVLGLIAKLAGKLTAHLSMEDKVLYPKLYQHPDQMVQEKAKSFFDEMGGLSQVFVDYCNKWDTEEVIQNDSAMFISETQGLFAALANRIDREDNELYPMADNA